MRNNGPGILVFLLRLIGYYSSENAQNAQNALLLFLLCFALECARITYSRPNRKHVHA